MHEEDYAKEEHGQPAANLGDDGELVKVRTRNGFVKRSLQRARTLISIFFPQESGWLLQFGGNLKWGLYSTQCNQFRGSYRGMSKYFYSTLSAQHWNITKEVKRTNKMAKNVKCEHWHVMLFPTCNVSHPLSVQFGRLPKRQEHVSGEMLKLEGF